MTGIPDYYKTLGVSPSATQDEIKRAWHGLARKYHPDAQRGKTPEERKAAEDRMKEVNEAYSVIGDDGKRRKYDEMRKNPFGTATGGTGGNGTGGTWQWTTSGGDAGGVDWDDVLRQVFGVGSAKAGGSDPFGGFGFGGGASPFGGGMGAVPRQEEQFRVTVPLSAAVSHGRVRIGVPGGKSVNVRLPADVHDGSVMRLRGLGSDGGDLLLRIGIALPPGYELDGDDVVGTVDVRFDRAMLGGRERVTLPSGKTVMLNVPAGTTAGRAFTFGGEGLGRSGRCVLKARIVVPSHLSDEAMGTLRRLSGEL